MRNTRSRPLATLASVAAIALIVAGCNGDSRGTPDPVDTDELLEGDEYTVGAMENFSEGDTFVATGDTPLNISVLYRDHPNYPIDNNWLFFTHLEENNNVTFSPQSIPLSDWTQGRSLTIAGGNAPDIIPSIYSGDEAQFVASGVLLPISDYIDLMPNFKAKAEAWGLWPEIEQQRQVDGRYYILPGLHENPFSQYSLVIRKDLFEASGFTEDPQTLEELADQLEQVTNDHGLEYGWSDKWSNDGPMDAALGWMADSFGTSAGWNFGDGLHWDQSAGEYVYAGAQDEFREMLTYLNDLVDRGVLDPESVSQDDDTAHAQFYSGRTAAISGNPQEILIYRDNFDDPEVELRLISVPAGPAGNISTQTRTESGIVFAATLAEKETFVATLQFVDWLYYSDEGLEYAKWGVEGETFNWEGDQRVLDENIDIQGLNPGAPEQLNVHYGFHNGVWMLAQGSTADLVQSMLRDEVVEFMEAMGQKEFLPAGDPYPYDEIEQETQSLAANSLGDLVRQNAARFIIGQRSLDDWDAYISELEAANLETFVQTANAATEREFDEDAFED